MVMDELRKFSKLLVITMQSFPGDIEEEQKTENKLPNASRRNTAKSYGWIIKYCLFFYLIRRTDASGGNITADSGQDVMLPCQTDPLGITDFYWQKLPRNGVVLHWSNHSLQPENQDKQYQNRTIIDNGNFARGNLSITILDVSLNDTGIYQCIIIKTQHVTPEKTSIKLHVKPPAEWKGSLTTTGFDKETTTSSAAGAKGRHHFIPMGCLILPIIALIIWGCCARGQRNSHG